MRVAISIGLSSSSRLTIGHTAQRTKTRVAPDIYFGVPPLELYRCAKSGGSSTETRL
jgi:hypothetical protein